MHKKQSLLIISVLVFLAACALPEPAYTPTPSLVPTDTPVPTATTALSCREMKGFIGKICTEPVTGLDYLVYAPVDAPASDAGMPLLVYLHGFSMSGSDPEVLFFGGIPAELEKGRALPMVVVSPQCPYAENWQTPQMVERLSRFVDEMIVTYAADPSRVILTGFSMGGDGTWALGQAHPDQFAALAPVSSDWVSRDAASMCVLKDMPIRVFQSEADELVNPKYAQQNLAQVQECGSSQIELTLFPSGGHEATAKQVYAMDDLYQWFLKQK